MKRKDAQKLINDLKHQNSLKKKSIWGFSKQPPIRCANKDLQRFANNCAKNVLSEQWFQELYKKFRHKNDLFNHVFYNKYIPDLVNHKYKYVIEIDGSIHDLPYMKAKDVIKDQYYKSKGYDIFRVKAYDKDSFNRCIYELYKIRDIPYLKACLNNHRQRTKRSNN